MEDLHKPIFEGTWHLREGEMTEKEIRSLAHLLYANMFTRIPEFMRAKLVESYAPIGSEPETFDLLTLPAELYVQKFAELYGLNADLLKRWANAASIELAGAVLSFSLAEGEHIAQTVSESSDAYTTHFNGIVDPITHVAQEGIRARIPYHCTLVNEAFYMGLDYPLDMPLNEELATGLFWEEK